MILHLLLGKGEQHRPDLFSYQKLEEDDDKVYQIWFWNIKGQGMMWCDLREMGNVWNEPSAQAHCFERSSRTPRWEKRTKRLSELRRLSWEAKDSRTCKTEYWGESCMETGLQGSVEGPSQVHSWVMITAYYKAWHKLFSVFWVFFFFCHLSEDKNYW